MSTITQNALSWGKLYLKLGWSLVPISPDTKIPTIAWKKYQTTPPTVEEITSWIEKGWYLAVVTGEVSGIIVVDDDRIKNGLPEYGLLLLLWPLPNLEVDTIIINMIVRYILT